MEETYQDFKAKATSISKGSTPNVKTSNKDWDVQSKRQSKALKPEADTAHKTDDMVDLGHGVLINKDILDNKVRKKDVREMILDMSKVLFTDTECARHCISGRRGRNAGRNETGIVS